MVLALIGFDFLNSLLFLVFGNIGNSSLTDWLKII